MPNGHFLYDQCEVATVANTQATIPAGRHLTMDQSTGVSIRPPGRIIDISHAEFQRLKDQGLVRD